MEKDKKVYDREIVFNEFVEKIRQLHPSVFSKFNEKQKIDAIGEVVFDMGYVLLGLCMDFEEKPNQEVKH